MKNVVLDEIKDLINENEIGIALEKLDEFVKDKDQELHNSISIQQEYYNDYVNHLDDHFLTDEARTQVSTMLQQRILIIADKAEQLDEEVEAPGIVLKKNKFDIDYILPEQSTAFIVPEAGIPTTAEDIISTVYHDEWFAKARIFIINTNKYDYFEDFLTDLQANHLENEYPLADYGKKWVIGNHSRFFKSLALPHRWLAEEELKSAQKEEEKTENIEETKANEVIKTPFKDIGMHIKFRSYYDWCECNFWGIVNSGFDKAFGLFTSDEAVFNDIFSGEFSSKLTGEFFSLIQRNDSKLTYHNYADLNPDDFKYKLIIQPNQPLDDVPNKSVFVL